MINHIFYTIDSSLSIGIIFSSLTFFFFNRGLGIKWVGERYKCFELKPNLLSELLSRFVWAGFPRETDWKSGLQSGGFKVVFW